MKNLDRLVLFLSMVFGIVLPVTGGIIPIGQSDFSGGEMLITYGPPAVGGSPVDGLLVSGVLHEFSVGGLASFDATVSGGGPGATNNVAPPIIEGDGAGLLGLTFSEPQNRVGFGFAILANGPLSDGTTVELFDTSDLSLGMLTFPAVSDPSFPGGFAGLQSSDPFGRAEVTFSSQALRFAFDNLRFESVVPEPTSALVWSLFAVAALGRGSRRRRRTDARGIRGLNARRTLR